jgi:hypothetical protein
MDAAENTLVQKILLSRREGKRQFAAFMRQFKEQRQLVEAELNLIADELHQEGIDWTQEPEIVAQLLKSRLGFTVDDDAQYNQRVKDTTF